MEILNLNPQLLSWTPPAMTTRPGSDQHQPEEYPLPPAGNNKAEEASKETPETRAVQEKAKAPPSLQACPHCGKMYETVYCPNLSCRWSSDPFPELDWDTESESESESEPDSKSKSDRVVVKCEFFTSKDLERLVALARKYPTARGCPLRKTDLYDP